MQRGRRQIRRAVAAIEALDQSRIVVTVAGESGVGKTTVARALGEATSGTVISQDDWFRYPPAENHARRLRDLSWVGPGEVRLDDLSKYVDAIQQGIVIVEGTYVTLLENVDLRIFIEGTLSTTDAARRARGRDAIDETTTKILAIEHDIIASHRDRADIVLPQLSR